MFSRNLTVDTHRSKCVTCVSHNHWCLSMESVYSDFHEFERFCRLYTESLNRWDHIQEEILFSAFRNTPAIKKRCRSTLMSMLHHNWCCSINTDGWWAGEGGVLVVCIAAGWMMERTSGKVEFAMKWCFSKSHGEVKSCSRKFLDSRLWQRGEWVSHRHGWIIFSAGSQNKSVCFQTECLWD